MLFSPQEKKIGENFFTKRCAIVFAVCAIIWRISPNAFISNVCRKVNQSTLHFVLILIVMQHKNFTIVWFCRVWSLPTRTEVCSSKYHEQNYMYINMKVVRGDSYMYRSHKTAPFLLFLDSHHYRITLELIRKACSNNILLLYRPFAKHHPPSPTTSCGSFCTNEQRLEGNSQEVQAGD